MSILPPIRVACQAVAEIVDALVVMLIGHALQVMGMAFRARIGGQRIVMTGGASASCIAMSQREAMAAIIGCGFPGAGAVASLAIRAEKPGVVRRVVVAGDAGPGRPRILAVDVAALAGEVLVPPAEREGALTVIEAGAPPTVGGVAGAAVLAVPAVMPIILSMTGDALRWCALQLTVEMAGLTCRRRGVLACEVVAGEIVIEIIRRYLRPIGSGMAVDAVSTELALVHIVLGVAVDAGL